MHLNSAPLHPQSIRTSCKNKSQIMASMMGKAQLCTVAQRNNYSKICLRNKTFPA